MYLVLVRHGESVYNQEDKFTGWMDVELTPKGEYQAEVVGKALKASGIEFGLAYTSVLKRAQKSLDIIKTQLGVPLKTKESYKLNERHYGALQGLNKNQVAERVGKEQVEIWRRSYDVAPPELKVTDPRFPGNDPKYSDILKFELPLSESLKDTYKRVVEYYESEISTYLAIEENVLIVAHGNSLRALVKYLENISDARIPGLEIPFGKAIVYKLDKNLNIVGKKVI